MSKIKPTFGPMNAVPCPWCKKALDFSDLDGQFSGGDFGGSSVGQNIGTGLSSKDAAKAACDHCGRSSVVAGVFRTPIVTIESNDKRGNFWLNNIKCAFCNNFQNLVDVYKQQAGYSDTYGALENFEELDDRIVGADLICDHCNNKSKIVGITKTPHIRLHPTQ